MAELEGSIARCLRVEEGSIAEVLTIELRSSKKLKAAEALQDVNHHFGGQMGTARSTAACRLVLYCESSHARKELAFTTLTIHLPDEQEAHSMPGTGGRGVGQAICREAPSCLWAAPASPITIFTVSPRASSEGGVR